MNKKVVKAGFWYLICNLLIKGISFISAPIFNRLLTKSQVGEYSNITSWVSIIAILATFELSSSIYNARFDFKGEKFDKYVSSILVLGTIITALELTVVLLFIDNVESFIGVDRKYIVLIFIYLLVYPAVMVFLAKSQAFLEYKRAIILSTALTLSTVVLSLALVLGLNDRLEGRVLGTYLPGIVIGLFLYFCFLKKGVSLSKENIKYSLSISMPLMFHLLSGSLLGSSDRIMITRFCGASDNALYSVAYIFSTFASLAWSSINNAFAPWSFEMIDKGEDYRLKAPANYMIVGFGVVVLIMSMLAPEGLLLLGGSSYIDAKYVVPPVLCGSLVCAAYTFYVNVEQFCKKQKYIALATMVSAVINVGMNALLLPVFGYIVAAYTTLLGYIVLYVIHFILTKCMLKKNIYSDVKIMIVLILFSTMSLLSSFLYSYMLVRYILVICLVAIIGFLLFKERKEIRSIVK